MDIKSLVGHLDALILHKMYRILYLEKIMTPKGLQLLVKLRVNSWKDVFFILPPIYSSHFTLSQIIMINNNTMYIDLVLLDYTREGFFLMEFIFAGGINCNNLINLHHLLGFLFYFLQTKHASGRSLV
jgi:hypothetical protein